MSTERQRIEAIRAVVEAARAYVNAPNAPEEEDPTSPQWSDMMQGLYGQLVFSVNMLEDLLEVRKEVPNQPYGEDLFPAWKDIPVGWFVQAPSGEWFEVVATKEGETSASQVVTISVNGNRIERERNAESRVTARRGSKTVATSDAIAALAEAFEDTRIIEDWS